VASIACCEVLRGPGNVTARRLRELASSLYAPPSACARSLLATGKGMQGGVVLLHVDFLRASQSATISRTRRRPGRLRSAGGSR